MKHIIFFLFFFISLITSGQNILGEWETYDDETNEKKALIEIYESDSKFYAKIVESYVKGSSGVCEKCEGAKKGKPIAGLVIIEGLEKDDDEYNGGTILDPEKGKTYKCYVELEEANKLKVRGYLGFALIGRTQYWRRKK